MNENNTDTDTAAPPSVYLHTRDVFFLMKDAARMEEQPDGSKLLIWSGHLTKLITGPPLNLPIPYYTEIRSALMAMGCATQIKRGGGTAISRWVLHKYPTVEEFKRWDNSRNSKRRVSKVALLEQRVNDMNTRMEGLEDAFQAFIEAVHDGEKA